MTLAADAALSGEFTLTYPGVGFTAPLAHDSSSDVIAAAIRSLGSEIGHAVSVSRDRTGVRGYSWTVTFDDLSAGDRPELTAANTSLQTLATGGAIALQVATLTNGSNAVGGTFELAFSRDERVETTGPLEHDSTAREVEAALEALVGVGDISVDVELLYGGDGGRVFSVVWPTGAGNMPVLRVNGSRLTPAETTGDGSIEAVVAYVNEVCGERL